MRVRSQYTMSFPIAVMNEQFITEEGFFWSRWKICAASESMHRFTSEYVCENILQHGQPTKHARGNIGIAVITEVRNWNLSKSARLVRNSQACACISSMVCSRCRRRVVPTVVCLGTLAAAVVTAVLFVHLPISALSWAQWQLSDFRTKHQTTCLESNEA